MVTSRQKSTFADVQKNNLVKIFDQIGRKDISVTKGSITLNASGRLASHTSATPVIIVGDLQFVTFLDKQWLSEGFAKVGDAVLYCKADADIDAEDIILVDGVSWETEKQVEGETINGNLIYQAWICTRREES